MFQEPLLPSLRSVLRALNIEFENGQSWSGVLQQASSSSANPTERRSQSNEIAVPRADASSSRHNELPSFCSAFGPERSDEGALSRLPHPNLSQQPRFSGPPPEPARTLSVPFLDGHILAHQKPSTFSPKRYPHHRLAYSSPAWIPSTSHLDVHIQGQQKNTTPTLSSQQYPHRPSSSSPAWTPSVPHLDVDLRAQQSPSISTSSFKIYPQSQPPLRQKIQPDPTGAIIRSDIHSLISFSSPQHPSGPAKTDFPNVRPSATPMAVPPSVMLNNPKPHPLHMFDTSARSGPSTSTQASLPLAFVSTSQPTPWSPNQSRSSTSTSPLSYRFSLDGLSSASDDMISDKGSPSGSVAWQSGQSGHAIHTSSDPVSMLKGTNKTASSIGKSSQRLKKVKYPEKSRVASSRKRVRGRFVKEDQSVLDENPLHCRSNKPMLAVMPYSASSGPPLVGCV